MESTPQIAYIVSSDATCPACVARHGVPLPARAGNPAKSSQGHSMYFTASGRTAACIL